MQEWVQNRWKQMHRYVCGLDKIMLCRCRGNYIIFCAQTLMSVLKKTMAVVRSASILLDHTTVHVSLGLHQMVRSVKVQ